MKKRSISSHPGLSRLSLLILLVTMSCSVPAMAMSGLEKKMKDTRLSISFNDEPLTVCITRISYRTNINFAYNPDELKEVRIPHMVFRKAAVDRILHKLLDKTDLQVKELNNHIVLYKRSAGLSDDKIADIGSGNIYPVNVAVQNVMGSNTEALSINAPKSEISGVVTDNAGKPVPGVSVSVKGTSQGTVTDDNGAFHLHTTDEHVVLVFSALGFQTQEIRASGSVVNVSLATRASKLDEVVVVGYGNQKRSDITGAISSVSGKEIENLPANDLAGALQGRIAGVVVTQGDGGPGSGTDIIIRGAGSINGLGPLYVVDGVPLGTGNNFNIQDVQSVEVLKDASSAAIYGVGAAGGVILVTTKHGSNRGDRKPELNFYGNYGVRKAVKLFHLLNTTDFFKARADINTNESSWGNPATLPNTDWVNVLYGNGKEQNYTASIAGGNNRSDYYVSGNYQRQDGIKFGTWYQRYGFRFNSDFNLNSRIKMGVSTYAWTNSNNPDAGDGSYPFRTVPTMKIYDPTNPIGGWGKQPPGGYYNGDNPYATQSINHYDNNNYGLDANVYLNWNILQGLTFRTTIATSLGSSSNSQFTEAYNYGTLANDLGTLNKTVSTGQFLMANYTLTYDRTFGDHHVKLLGGYEAKRGIGSDINGYTSGFNAQVARDFALATAAQGSRNVNGTVSDSRTLSQFGRLNYDYKDKYLIEGSLRRDGEDKFGPDNRWGVFPSVSGAWRLSEEPFLRDAVSYISNLKLRAGYGSLGNDGALGQFLYIPSYSAINVNAFSPGDRSPGWGDVVFPNAAIKWETVNTTDFGVDFGFLQNRLSVVVDWYSRQTHNMIYNVSTPPSAGIGNYNGGPASIPVNIGQVSNKGLELAVGYSDHAGDFQYSINTNFTFNSNKVLKLGFDTIPFPNGGAGPNWNNTVALTQVGRPMSSFYGYIADGIFKTDAEAAASATPNAKAGDLKYRDLNHDGAINDQDKTYIGNPWPKLVYNFSLNFSYKGFDLEALFTGVHGVDIYNGTKGVTESLYGDYNTTADIFKTSFFGGNGVTNAPRIGYPDNTVTPAAWNSDPNGNYKNISSFFVESGSYLKLKNLQIGYNLGKAILQRAGVASIRIYFMTDNLFTITKYSGLDPEIAGGVTQRGIDGIGIYPHTRLTSVGLNIGF